MGFLAFVMSILSPSSGGGGQGGPIPQIEGQGEIDLAHYEAHAQHGNERAEQIDQATEELNTEIWNKQKGEAKGQAKLAQITAENARIGENWAARCQGKQQMDTDGLLAGQTNQQQVAPVVSPGSFKTFLASKQQQQHGSAATTPAPTPKQHHTPGHNL